MAKKKSNINQDNSQKLYLTYFNDITLGKMFPKQLLAFNENELKKLLQNFGLSEHYPIFSKLASLASGFQESWKFGNNLMKNLDELDNQEIDLLSFAWNLILKKISWIEIICSSGEKVKLTYPSTIHELGEAINQKFSNIKNQDELKKLKKNIRNKGRIPSKEPIQHLSLYILAYLNHETLLKSGNTLISNKQARFIFDFLLLTKVIKLDTTKVLDEEYIRTLLNNFKTKYPETFNSILFRHLK